MGRLQSIQVLRAVAALAVIHAHAVDVVDHLGQSYGMLAPAGYGNVGAYGVDLFFVISGFIMATIAKGPVHEFLRDRIVRIVPLYWLMSIPWIFVWFSLGDWRWERLAATLTFTLVWDYRPLLEVGWTLCFEMLFYVACAVVLASSRKAATAWGLVGLWLFCLALPSQFTSFIGHPMVLEFLLGVLVARLRPAGSRIGAALLLVGLIVVLGAAPFLEQFDGFGLALGRTILMGPASAMLVYGAVSMEPVRLPGLSYLGDASYSIYLAHYLALLAWEFFCRGAALPSDIVMLGALSVGLAAGIATYEGIEKPLLARLKQKSPLVAPA